MCAMASGLQVASVPPRLTDMLPGSTIGPPPVVVPPVVVPPVVVPLVVPVVGSVVTSPVASLLAAEPEHATRATIVAPTRDRDRISLTTTNIRDSRHVECNRAARRSRPMATAVAHLARHQHLHADPIRFPSLSRTHVRGGVPGRGKPAGATGR